MTQRMKKLTYTSEEVRILLEFIGCNLRDAPDPLETTKGCVDSALLSVLEGSLRDYIGDVLRESPWLKREGTFWP